MLFKDIAQYAAIAGQWRVENISKSEPVLHGSTVAYEDYPFIVNGLEYYFGKEKGTTYSFPLDEAAIAHLGTFITDIWRVHPFREGNTRTIAVFMEIYMAGFGVPANNTLFKDHAAYFRDALVRAAYANRYQGVEPDPIFLRRLLAMLYGGQQSTLERKEPFLKLTGEG
ncbi:MAG: Fic family protein [Coriobacteriales bacterium]|jgi:fido (protein-threonine AMPylation protein)|nr:Fic family protein [Coriobacteriales bacterium]